jgi:hypothetical protein
MNLGYSKITMGKPKQCGCSSCRVILMLLVIEGRILAPDARVDGFEVVGFLDWWDWYQFQSKNSTPDTRSLTEEQFDNFIDTINKLARKIKRSLKIVRMIPELNISGDSCKNTFANYKIEREAFIAWCGSFMEEIRNQYLNQP